MFTFSTKREIRHFHVVVVRGKKCTKKRDARAELLFCPSQPIAFLPFSLTSPSSLLKLPNVQTIGSLSKDVFEQRTSTGSEDFSLVICLDAM